MRKLLEQKFFPFVMKPGRYAGGEPGQVVKEAADRTCYLHCYPDKYELGQSYVGLQTLYHIVNSDDRFLCERAFAVDTDAEEIMLRENIPLFSLESSRPAKEFDAIGFTVAFELVYTNMLAMLDLAGIPLFSKDRTDDDPIIMAGGPAVYNPEPMAPFIDLFFIGDGEEGLPQILTILHEMKGESRQSKLEAIGAQVESVYIPAFYDDDRKPIRSFAPEGVKARLIGELKPEYYPPKPILPLIETIHNHLSVEIMRGCPQGCRFCQAGPVYRPVRVRPIDDIVHQVEQQLKNSGYDGVTLMSLSSSDYPEIEKLAGKVARMLDKQKVSIGLPALRPGTIGPALLEAASRVRKGGLTMAPEAGTERLRLFIRKDFPDEAIYDSARIAYQKGWQTIKLYFMVGLPTETDQDLIGIANLIGNIYSIGREYEGRKTINVSLSPFVPKPHTPFQWDEMCPPDEIDRKIRLVKRHCRNRHVNFKYSSSESSVLQCLLGRSGREAAPALLAAYRKGCRFDAWSEQLKADVWFDCLETNGINVEKQLKAIPFSARLPWSIVQKGQSPEHLQAERNRTSNQLKEYQPKASVDGNAIDSGRPAAEFGRSKKRVASRTAVAPTKNRVRIRWGKTAQYRYMSHLDNIRMIERAIRRAAIPVAFSQGFNPGMKLSFGPPLPLGFTSQSEFADITLESNLSSTMIDKLRDAIFDGWTIYEANPVYDKGKSLSALLNRVVYTLDLTAGDGYSELPKAIEKLLNTGRLEIQRQNKKGTTTINIRPGIYDIYIEADQLRMTLGLGQSVYVRPTEVLDLLIGEKTARQTSYAFHRQDMYRIDESGRKQTMMGT